MNKTAMDDKKISLIIERLKEWEHKVPLYILKLTPEEIYIHGFDSGYKCKKHEIEQLINKIPMIKFPERNDE